MGDALLADSDIEEALSQAYAYAIASYAGYTVCHGNFDRDGVDLTIAAGGGFRPKIDIQLKASINLDDSGSSIAYFCPKRNYDLLRIETQTPRLLVLLRLPRPKAEWLTISATDLVLRHSAYWVSLAGAPETTNATGQTVNIPTTNRFDVDGLRKLMALSRTGKIA